MKGLQRPEKTLVMCAPALRGITPTLRIYELLRCHLGLVEYGDPLGHALRAQLENAGLLERKVSGAAMPTEDGARVIAELIAAYEAVS